MELVIGNLRLFDVPEGFAAHYDKIQEAKLNVLFYLSHRYGDAAPVFFEVYGQWALLRETDKLLSSCFDSFTVLDGASPVDSSPINNRPKVLLDQQVVELDVGEIMLINTDTLEEIDPIVPNTILSVNLPMQEERYMQVAQQAFVIGDAEPPMEEHFLFRQIMAGARNKDWLTQMILSKLLKGESICG